jgi:hypothetical protein
MAQESTRRLLRKSAWSGVATGVAVLLIGGAVANHLVDWFDFMVNPIDQRTYGAWALFLGGLVACLGATSVHLIDRTGQRPR